MMKLRPVPRQNMVIEYIHQDWAVTPKFRLQSSIASLNDGMVVRVGVYFSVQLDTELHLRMQTPCEASLDLITQEGANHQCRLIQSQLEMCQMIHVS